jgi:Holliday junction resolvase RusA-like endonuclease
MGDVLTFTVVIGTRYPSVNHQGSDGFRGGRKSDAYKKLYTDVVTAARAEIERTEWVMATTECALTVIRYLPDRRRADASNLAKTECDALTNAGVWNDDRLASPCTLLVRYDPHGSHRLAIVVVKLHQSGHEPMLAKGGIDSPQPRVTRRSSRAERVSTSAAPYPPKAVTDWRAGDPIPPGYADLNGKLVTRAFALEKAGIK